MTGPGPRFDKGQMERIIARAVEAQSDLSDSYSADDVMRIAGELGIPPEQVRRAMAEELRTPRSTRRGLFDTEVVSSRLVDGTPDEVGRKVTTWLQRNEAMRLRRREGVVQVWEKDPRPLANIRAGLGLIEGGNDLRSTGAVEVIQEPVPGGVNVSMRSSGAMLKAGAGVAFGTLSAGGLAGAILLTVLASQPWAWIYLFLPALVLATVVAVAAVRTGTSGTEGAMERALDGIAEGAPPREDSVSDVIQDLRDTWTKKAKGPTRRRNTLDL